MTPGKTLSIALRAAPLRSARLRWLRFAAQRGTTCNTSLGRWPCPCSLQLPARRNRAGRQMADRYKPAIRRDRGQSQRDNRGDSTNNNKLPTATRNPQALTVLKVARHKMQVSNAHWMGLTVLAVLGNSWAWAAGVSEQQATGNDTEIEQQPLWWLRSAQDMFASPAGHVVVQVAKELLHRSAGNSQVLSLNLTNLLIIVLLKVLIFSAGLLGAGHWSGYGHGYARSAARSASSLGLHSGDDYLIMGFLAAQGAGQDDCLYAAACACPNAAYEYAKAGRALLGAIEMFESAPSDKPRYNDLIVLLERAAYDGYRGVSCNTTQSCDGLL